MNHHARRGRNTYESRSETAPRRKTASGSETAAARKSLSSQPDTKATVTLLGIPDEPCDEGELAAKAMDQAVVVSLLNGYRTTGRLIRDALTRMNDGTYGKCLRCKRRISEKRLDAVPWAPFCLSCQEHEVR